jgi:ribokinase
LRDARVTVAQLEIPMDAVHAAASSAGGTFILNPAPAKPLPHEILERVDVLTPNEIELAMLAGAAVDSMRAVVEAARSIEGPDSVVVTLGGQGAVVVTPDRTVELPALRVDVVDTTAAGDAFCGALAEAVAHGRDLEAASEWAVAAAAVSVTKMGAQPSLPTREEVDRLIASH